MAYSDITFNDRNPIKRWLQRRRLESALSFAGSSLKLGATICDFGAGNGELCKLILGRYQSVDLFCYEPAPQLMVEAKQNLASLRKVVFATDVAEIADKSIDVLFCLEVFEHLPPEETEVAIRTFAEKVKPGGIIVIGVPNELGIPALYKGALRWIRRRGAYDASIKNIAAAFLGKPNTNRPLAEISPGVRFYYEHMGFDYRRLETVLRDRFEMLDVGASPFNWMGVWLMPEVYYIVRN